MLGLVLPDLYEAIANVGRISSLGESTVVELVESRVVERIDRVLDPKGRLKQLNVYACKYREQNTSPYHCNLNITADMLPLTGVHASGERWRGTD